MINYKN